MHCASFLNLDSCRCWRCTLCPCKVRNKFLVNFWNRTIILCIPCISESGSRPWRILDYPSSGRPTSGTVTDQIVRTKPKLPVCELEADHFQVPNDNWEIRDTCIQQLQIRLKQLLYSNSGFTMKMRRTNQKLRYKISVSQKYIIMYGTTSLFAAFDNLLQNIWL